VFAYGADGKLQRDYTVDGQDVSNNLYGLYGLADDAVGNVYLADRVPARVVKLDRSTGAQSDYARIPDLKPCLPAGGPAPCSKASSDQQPFPDGLAFGPRGELYVTDSVQAAIWRIPPGGGEPQLLISDARFDASVSGPNGITVSPDGRTLTVAQSNFPPGPGADYANGRIYKVPLSADGAQVAGDLQLLWEGKPFDVPDGFAVGRSGRLYVALSGADSMLILGPDGKEIGRFPSSDENARQEVPFDKPASVAFLGDRALVTNQSLFNRDPTHWAVLAVGAGETGQAPFRPGARLRLALTPPHVSAGRRTRFTATVTSGGAPASGAKVQIGRARALTAADGTAHLSVPVTRAGLRRAHAALLGYVTGTARYRAAARPRR
jgi:DNA-binding beta-propeller fold protein YncE